MSQTKSYNDPHFNGLAEYKYANPAGIFYSLIEPKNLYVIAGRATGKTTDIQARRSLKIQKSMPGAYFAFVGDYYSNLLSNTVPSMIHGWKEAGYKEGVHYVTNEAPPASFEKPYKKPLSYKHTISVFNGCFYKMASMDVVSSVAGDSYQHIFGDEVKYLIKEKLDKLLPAARGEFLRFGHSPYYLGRTFTTDMPNILNANEYDWILDQEENMDVEQIRLILLASITVNDIKIAMIKARARNDRNEYEKQKRAFYRWNQRLYKARTDSTLFHMISSFANADILRLEYFVNSLESMSIEQFKASILTLRHEIMQGEKFYPRMEPRHFYDDGLLLEFFDNFDFGDKPVITSDGLRYCNPRQKLEAGMDFGDMMSLVVGQEQGWTQRLLKNFWTLAPENEIELGAQFVSFFRNHKMKLLELYHDRSGNQYQKLGRDWATAVKNAIEVQDGKRTGWTVRLMSAGQATIYQEEEFNLMSAVMSEQNPKLPKLLIDRIQCKELKSSMEVAKMIVKPDKKGVRRVHKDKSSENIPLPRRPMWSTNMSDALKYYLCRPKYMNIIKGVNVSTGAYAPVLH